MPAGSTLDEWVKTYGRLAASYPVNKMTIGIIKTTRP